MLQFDVDDVDEDVGLDEMCRDERCTREDIHRRDADECEFPQWVWKSPKAIDPPRGKDAAQLLDSAGLTLSILKVIESTDWPWCFGDVFRAVVDDYGSIAERTVHRHLRMLIADGKVAEMNLELPFVAYIRPQSRFLRDRSNLREHLVGRLGETRARHA